LKSARTSSSGINRGWRAGGERGTLLHCWGKCKLVQPLWKTGWRFLKRLEVELPYDPASALLGIHPRDTGELPHWGTRTLMFTAAPSTTAQVWQGPKRPSADEWITKMWFIDTTEYYSVIEKNEILPFATTQSEMSQRKTTI
ncbi:LORF2 protein, partial [Crocuta crocuta]